ncbi:hypothetical protein EDB89DRAFT_2240277 [Lactarius sanguifluus]|nr:hypothetical protein EDB89DRAFT_2240277 [Lactarius sanguifluus]
MTTTTMHFGPEWMRPKHALRPQNPPSPPPNPNAPSGVSSYSALLTPSLNNTQESSDSANPFLYSKEDLLKIYREGGGRRGLGLDVERWEGVVREVGSEPVTLKEWTEGERKLFAGSINSEVRRRQSSDYLSPLATQPGERQKLSHTGPGVASPLRERFGGLMRKRDGSDQPALTIPRKLSLSSTQGPLGSPRDGSLPSPRTRGPVTPSFDGILNSGETWVSRRRASESGTRLNSGATRGDGDTEPLSGNRLKIDEVEEEQQRHSGPRPDSTGKNASQNSDPSPGDSPQGAMIPVNDSATSPPMNGPEGSTTFHGVTQPPAQVLVDGLPAQSPTNPTPVTAASQHVANPASVEWSYLDPQGQVQGPFQAELMQKWYEEGYFALDLLMRRANLDEDWTPVVELAQRAGSERIFFFNFDAPAAPPGLSRRREPSRDHFQQQRESNGYNAPYQPVPTRTVHPNLDSYFASSSPASNSPSSSFGAGRFGNNSPDPTAFGGLIGVPIPSNDSPINSRPGTFTDTTFIGTRRIGYTEAPFEQGFTMRASIGNAGPTRTSSVDSYGLNPTIPSQPPWGSSTSVHSASLGPRTGSYDHMGPGPFASHLGSGLDPAYSAESSLTRGLTAQQDALGQNFGNVNQRDLSRLGTRDLYQIEHHTGLGLGGFDGPGGSPFESPVQHQPFNQSPSTNFPPPASQQANSPSVIAPTSAVLASVPSTMPLSQSAWPEATESAPKRSGLTPFDNAAFPTSRNTTATRTAPPPPAQSWAAVQQSNSGESPQSPWSSAAQGVVDEGWGHIPGPHSLTVSNLTQHTQQQESGEDFSRDNVVTVDSPVEPVTLPERVQPPVQNPSIPAEPPQQPHRPSRKFSIQTNPAQPTIPTTPTPPAIPQPTNEPTPSSSTVSVPTKLVWSTEDDKNKSTGGPTSLREIQELEAKKQDARKTTERERARATAAATASPSEDSQTFTASWGLPTSQVGAKASSKEAVGAIVPSASSTSATVSSMLPAQSTPPAAVWTNAQKPAAKKSMRDILEEEERRKKAAAKESVASAAARRAYAETTNKATPAILSTGGAWTTVGANGKTAAAAIATPSVGRMPIAPSSSTGSVAVPSRGTATTAPTARSPVPPAKVNTPPKADDTPVAPSPDFMKWLNDSLKQLNSSVNYEEIASMLLSFPLDGDATTVEIISELIYDNSTTLDGRRFAQEFIAKRKTDATSRKPSGRAPSIADVVKAQPKPSQQAEWGGFKVVKQKKKGGRS